VQANPAPSPLNFTDRNAANDYRRAWRLNRAATAALRAQQLARASVFATLRSAYFALWRAKTASTVLRRVQAAAASVELFERAHFIAKGGVSDPPGT
jgi:hypothetical protein